MITTSPLRIWQARVFVATWLCYFGLYFCRKPFYMAKAEVGTTLGLDSGGLKWVGAAYLIAYAIGQFSAGVLGTRFGPRKVILTGMAVTIVCNAALPIAPSTNVFTALMFVNGLAQASGWSSVVGIMGNWFNRAERGTVMGFWGTHFVLGGVAANPLAAWTRENWGYPWAFWSGSMVLASIWLVVYFNGAQSPAHAGLDVTIDEGEDAAEALSGPPKWTRDLITNVVLIGVFYFFVKFIRYALWSWAPFLLETQYNLKGDAAGYLSTVFDVGGAFGVVLIGWLSDRFFGSKRTPVAFLFILLMVASCLLLYTAGTTSLTWFGISIGLIGFSLYGPDALMSGAAAIDVGDRRTATMAAGIINGMGSVGSVVQELVLGEVLKGKDAIGATFGVLLASSVLAAMCLGVLVARTRAGHGHV